MKIAYGVMGYGRGHAMRTRAVLPALLEEHEVTVFAGGDAHESLSDEFQTVRVPTLGYVYGAKGRLSPWLTVTRNSRTVADWVFSGAETQALESEFRDRQIDLVISDSEISTLRTARKLNIPSIGFDHIGIIAWCEPHFPPELWLQGMRDAAAYRFGLGRPDRILISSFYQARPRDASTRLIPPILRAEVLQARPGREGFLLAYFNKGQHQYRPAIDRALRQLDREVLVYGTPFRGKQENLEFRPPSNAGFLADLSACDAVLCTAGSQLIGEATFLGKPILALPEDAFEQRLNAYMVQKMGIGGAAGLGELTPSVVDQFLGILDRYRVNMARHAEDGRPEAVRVLRQYIRELAGRSFSFSNVGNSAGNARHAFHSRAAGVL